MIPILIRMDVRQEKRKELQQTLQSIVSSMKTIEGCKESCLYQNAENEDKFLIIAAWSSREALDDYQKSNQFSVLVGTRALLTGPPEIQIHTVLTSSELTSPGIKSATKVK